MPCHASCCAPPAIWTKEACLVQEGFDAPGKSGLVGFGAGRWMVEADVRMCGCADVWMANGGRLSLTLTLTPSPSQVALALAPPTIAGLSLILLTFAIQSHEDLVGFRKSTRLSRRAVILRNLALLISQPFHRSALLFGPMWNGLRPVRPYWGGIFYPHGRSSLLGHDCFEKRMLKPPPAGVTKPRHEQTWALLPLL